MAQGTVNGCEWMRMDANGREWTRGMVREAVLAPCARNRSPAMSRRGICHQNPNIELDGGELQEENVGRCPARHLDRNPASAADNIILRSSNPSTAAMHSTSLRLSRKTGSPPKRTMRPSSPKRIGAIRRAATPFPEQAPSSIKERLQNPRASPNPSSSPRLPPTPLGLGSQKQTLLTRRDGQKQRFGELFSHELQKRGLKLQ